MELFNTWLHDFRQKNRRTSPQGIAFQPQDSFLERLGFFNRSFQQICIQGDLPSLKATEASSSPYDLILNFWQWHAINDLQGYLRRTRETLLPDGLLMACFPGENTLKELRLCLQEIEIQEHQGVSPRISPLLTIQDTGKLLMQAGFSLPVVDVDRHILSFKDIYELISLLRHWGETNCLVEKNKKYVGRTFWEKVQQRYQELFPHPDGIQATFDILTLTAWAPSANQQQPLKPGSARLRLEHSLSGEPHV